MTMPSPLAGHALLDLLRPGTRAYLSGGSAEPAALARLLAVDPQRLDGVTVSGSFVPGVNTTDYAAMHPGARMETLLMLPAARESLKAGRIDILPMSYTGYVAHLQRLPPDLAIVQVTPPDAAGRCHLGPASDFAPLVWSAAARRIAFINPDLPAAPGSHALPSAEIDLAIECDGAAIALPPARPSGVLDAIAGHVAALVADGDAVQTGLGGAPAAALAALTSHRDLVIHSGMVGDEYRTLAEAGALAPIGHRTGMAIGSASFYDWLAGADGLEFVPTPLTHSALAIAALPRFIAINSALEVDLFGQANLEWRSGELVSGMGGAPDFAGHARLSDGGRSVIALPAATRTASRIVPRIMAPTVSLPRNAVDIVVTEHGVAHIRDLGMERRAQALIGIAAPEHRDALQEAWQGLRNAI
jgi:acyl-CoA hydrolase